MPIANTTCEDPFGGYFFIAPMNEFPVSKVCRLIEPGPVLLVTTSQHDRPNIMTIGFHMMIQHEPPLIGCIIGPWDHSFTALQETRECVLAVPGIDLAQKVVDIGNCSGTEVDKFKKFRLSSMLAKSVAAPLVGECLANIECKVKDTTLVNKYDLFIFEAVHAWTNPGRKEKRTFHHRGDGTFTVDGRVINLQDRMTKWKQFQD
jgi:flavin reductase (DIM6/NTAB) family NADH-FMN oxidoreductase RutF